MPSNCHVISLPHLFNVLTLSYETLTRSSAIAEGPRNTPVSTNPATTKHPTWNDCNRQM